MTRHECAREREVVEAVGLASWPEGIDADLRQHVEDCEICADVALVVRAMAVELDEEIPKVTAAPIVWFRAQAKARADAAREAARPVAVMQALSLAVVTAVVSVLIGAGALWVWTNLDELARWPSMAALPVDALSLAVRGTLLAIGLWLVLAPVAVYLVAADD